MPQGYPDHLDDVEPSDKPLRVVKPDENGNFAGDYEGEGGQEGADEAIDSLAAHITAQFHSFRSHSENISLRERCLTALRAYSGEYSASKKQQIAQFGGSDVYARITSIKCRGATALLRDVFLGQNRTWGVDPTPVPDLPEDMHGQIQQLLAMEAMQLSQAGQPVTHDMIEQRRQQLFDAATKAGVKKAREEAKKAELKLDDILTEGAFYETLIEFLTDLPIMPFACIKGPVVKQVHDLKWREGKISTKAFPRMYWHRVSPMDLYWTPGATNVNDASIIEHIKTSRADLNQLIGLPGYSEKAIRGVLNDYANGLIQPLMDDSTRAELEDREQPGINRSELLDTLEWHGPIQGHQLIEYGFTGKQIADPDLDYHVTAWVIGKHTIKVQINPNANKRHPYYITSFEKKPGSIIGSCIPEILEDIQDVANATLRSLVNNMSIASGPQVVVNEDMLSATTNADSLYPWKRWRTISDPMGSNAAPVNFFQPDSNAQELLGVYKAMSDIADEVSAIPRYLSGNDNVGGAARTASGLSMLLNNASKMLLTVASNIDRDIFNPLLQSLYDMILLVDQTGMFRGDEKIRVRGVEVAAEREQERMRKLEFLQLTANEIDMSIVGPKGRAAVLRDIAGDLNMPGDEIVPSAAEMEAMMAPPPEQAAPGGGGGGGVASQPGRNASAGSLTEGMNNQFRTRTPKAVSNQIR
jgi:hypothetical protein